MKTASLKFEHDKWVGETENNIQPQLIFLYGERMLLETNEHYFTSLKTKYPNASIAILSTSGTIVGTKVIDEALNAFAIEFNKTTVTSKQITYNSTDDAFTLGKKISSEACSSVKDIKLLYVLSDGACLNGSEFVRGLTAGNTLNIPITGGLAGDAARFEKPVVGLNALPSTNNIITVALSGNNTVISYGTFGGWEPFGPERVITKSTNNVLYELDDKPALDLYKSYLGDKADKLKDVALLFPLYLKIDDESYITRAILSFDEKEKSLTFGGNVPQGSTIRIMKSSVDKVIDGSGTNASNLVTPEMTGLNSVAFIVSCVARKLVLGERVEEELDEFNHALNLKNVEFTGFYSYAEFCPVVLKGENTEIVLTQSCQLHNETLTVTLISE